MVSAKEMRSIAKASEEKIKVEREERESKERNEERARLNRLWDKIGSILLLRAHTAIKKASYNGKCETLITLENVDECELSFHLGQELWKDGFHTDYSEVEGYRYNGKCGRKYFTIKWY
jgi:hypothetical protein